MKKWTRWGIGLLCAAVVTFGVSSLAGVSNADEASATVTGTVKTIDAASDNVTVTTDDGSVKTVPISKTVWVFLDNHKAQISDIGTGFKVELILNGKKQAGYIKAISITVNVKPDSNTAPAPSAAAAPNAAQSPAAVTQSPAAAPQSPAAAAQPQASTTSAPSPVAAAAGAPWESLHLKIEGNGFKMDIFDKGDHNNGTSMIKMKPKGRDGFFLKGDEAEHWIRTLLAGVDLKAPNAQQQITAAFQNWFELNGITLNVNIDIKAKVVQAEDHAAEAAKTAETAAVPSSTAVQPSAAPSVPANPPAASIQPKVQISVNHDDEDDDQGEDEDNDGKNEHKKGASVKVEVKQKDHDKEKDKHSNNGNGNHKNGKDD